MSGFGRPEGVFHVPEVAQHTDFEDPPPGGKRTFGSGEGLVDDPGLALVRPGKFGQAGRLEEDKADK